MSRVYCMDRDQSDVTAMLQAEKVPGLKHATTDASGKPWPDANGVTDGTNYGWFDSNLLEFFGDNDENPILHTLAKHGVNIVGQLY